MSKLLQGIRIARVSTIPFFVFTQLRAQLEALAEAGAQVSIISSDDELSNNLQMIEGCEYHSLSIAREISFFADLLTLFRLWKLFRREQFEIVHSTTPKAGLLCAIAGKLAGVPVCVHTYTGQPWVTMKGIKKALVKYSDKLMALLNTCCYTDSFSQRDFLIQNKIANLEYLKVIGSGSLAGVDTGRFSVNNNSDESKEQLKKSLNIDPSTKVLLFVGRVTREKGVFELIDAVHLLLKASHNVVLLIVGPFELYNEEEIRHHAQKHCGNKVIFAGFQDRPEDFMAISDLLCLPSYREGFGTVVIEAAAMELPVVGTKIYGLTDAVVDGVTGILIEPKNSSQLFEALNRLLSDNELRLEMGLQAKKRAINDFDIKNFNTLLIQEYLKLIKNSKAKIVNKVDSLNF
jgi:glycosyltransferase involved in cell wall biosynthesis